MAFLEAVVAAARYLKAYGLLPVDAPETLGGSLNDALAAFQESLGLPVSGVPDGPTVHAMQAPRCGCSDALPVGLDLAKWTKPVLRYYVENYVGGLDRAVQQEVFAKGWMGWSNVCGIRIGAAPTANDADIVISVGRGRPHDFDGPGRTLAWAELPQGNNAQLLMRFDLDEAWIVDPGRHGILMQNVFNHESGHLLGLSHSRVPGALMAPIYNPSVVWPQANDDVVEVQKRYGRPVVVPTEPPATNEYTIRVKGEVSIDGHRILRRKAVEDGDTP